MGNQEGFARHRSRQIRQPAAVQLLSTKTRHFVDKLSFHEIVGSGGQDIKQPEFSVEPKGFTFSEVGTSKMWVQCGYILAPEKKEKPTQK